MTKYALYIDYKSGTRYDYITMDAKNLEDAIAEADAIRKDKEVADPIYLIRIMKKVGNIATIDKGVKQELYEACLCKRSCGWHLNNFENGEGEHKAVKTWITKYADQPWYEAI